MAEHSNLFYVTDGTFEEKVLKSPIPVVVDFWATWCGPCRMIAPVYERLSDEYQGRLGFAKLDIDENERTTMRMGIQGVPTLIIFSGGREVKRLVGPHPTRLKTELDRALAEISVA